MTTHAQADEAMCQALQTAVAPLDLIVLWPNVDPPLPHPREGESAWAAFHISHDGGDQRTLGERGRRTFTRTGGFVLQVFVPAGQRGLEEATALAKPAVDAFEGETLEGVRFRRVGMHTVGRDGAWFQVNVRGDFEFDEVK